jgi:hypothetical protein
METLKIKPKNSGRLYDKNAPVWKLLRNERKPFDFLADIEKTFLQFDLSRNEIRVYLYLARSGVQKAREISDTLSLHRTREAWTLILYFGEAVEVHGCSL